MHIGATWPVSSVNLYIGQNRDGQWIVKDAQRRYGGIFRFRKDALRFALSRDRAAAVFMVPGPIDLSFGEPVQPASLCCREPRGDDRVNGSAKPARYEEGPPATEFVQEFAHERRPSDADPHRR